MSTAYAEVTAPVTRCNEISRPYEGPDRREPAHSRAEAIGLAMDEIDQLAFQIRRRYLGGHVQAAQSPPPRRHRRRSRLHPQAHRRTPRLLISNLSQLAHSIDRKSVV